MPLPCRGINSKIPGHVLARNCRISTVGIILRYSTGGKLAFNPTFRRAFPLSPRVSPRRKQGLTCCSTATYDKSGGKGDSSCVFLLQEIYIYTAGTPSRRSAAPLSQNLSPFPLKRDNSFVRSDLKRRDSSRDWGKGRFSPSNDYSLAVIRRRNSPIGCRRSPASLKCRPTATLSGIVPHERGFTPHASGYTPHASGFIAKFGSLA